MAGPPSPRDRAVAGLAWCVRGLVGFLILTLSTACMLLALAFLFALPSPDLFQTVQLEDLLGLLSWALLVLGVAAGVMYCVGLAGLYGPRHDLGPAHTASVERTRTWIAAILVLLGTGIVVPSLTFPLLGFPGIGYAPPSWSWSASVVLAGLRAIFAGLTLYYAVQGLGEEDARVRLLLGMSLGVLGAIVWSGLASYAAAFGVASMDSLLPFLAGVVAGLGSSAISLALFAAVYREIRRELATATVKAA
jgi:hypothetical protein